MTHISQRTQNQSSVLRIFANSWKTWLYVILLYKYLDAFLGKKILALTCKVFTITYLSRWHFLEYYDSHFHRESPTQTWKTFQERLLISGRSACDLYYSSVHHIMNPSSLSASHVFTLCFSLLHSLPLIPSFVRWFSLPPFQIPSSMLSSFEALQRS